jgi:hypothetical protein
MDNQSFLYAEFKWNADSFLVLVAQNNTYVEYEVCPGHKPRVITFLPLKDAGHADSLFERTCGVCEKFGYAEVEPPRFLGAALASNRKNARKVSR